MKEKITEISYQVKIAISILGDHNFRILFMQICARTDQ